MINNHDDGKISFQTVFTETKFENDTRSSVQNTAWILVRKKTISNEKMAEICGNGGDTQRNSL